MNDRFIIGLARTAAALGLVMATVGSAAYFALGQVEAWWSTYAAFGTMLAVSFGVLVWLVIPSQPLNRVLWVLGASSFLNGFWVAGFAAALVRVRDDVEVLDPLSDTATLIPAKLPASASWILQFAGPASIAGLMLAVTFGLLLFPDGALPGPRWRWFSWVSAAGVALTVAGSAWSYRPSNPGFVDTGWLIDIGIVVALIAAAGALFGLLLRFRRGSEATRMQLKWTLWGASAFIPALVAASVVGGTDYDDLVRLPFMVGAAIFLGAIGVSVGRHDLFDVDLVISRTVVVAGLAFFITTVYAVVVGAIGFLLGGSTDSAVPLSVAATVVVAIAFQPLRERMHRWANRLVFGERATPYEVLSRLADRMRDAAATHDLIPQMAKLLTEGTGAASSTVWVQSDDRLIPVASWPETSHGSIDTADHVAPVEHDRQTLGALTVVMPSAEEITSAGRRLVDDLATQAGLVLKNERLIQELRASRQRLVAAQDEERRRLERNLHDGAQQQLVALKIKLGLLRAVEDPEKRETLVDALLAETDDAIDSLRNLARGIYPPTLARDGLVSALQAQANRATVPTSVEASEIARYSPDVEAAVYFCALEALQNIAKYANASSAWVRLAAGDGSLRFEVGDDGCGFEPSQTKRGAGLQNMEDRLEALGGSVETVSRPGRGTTITGALPAVALPPTSP